jgi:predicted nucleic acid binding AN1-type Zn finger protein
MVRRAVCNCESCSNSVMVVVGECRYCSKGFCASHRLPETHACVAMETCRQDAKDRNASLLFAQKCVAAKI